MPSFHPPYAVHPSVAYQQAIIDNLAEKTGRSLEEWMGLVVEGGQTEIKACRAWLKARYGLGGTTTAIIASRALRPQEESDAQAYLAAAPGFVDAMYSGARGALRPLHDRLVREAMALGADVAFSPAKTIVPVYRRRVFAQIKPSTQTRIDLGLALKGVAEPPPKPLIDTGGSQSGDRITHRIGVFSEADVDDTLRHWLRVAYEQDG